MRLLHPHAAAAAKKYIGVSHALEPLGWGVGGAVFASPLALTAVKVHLHQDNFDRELAAYQRLREFKVSEIQSLSIPQLVNSRRVANIIEMSIVTKPYLLDFAHAKLDEEPDFGEGRMDEWWESLRERFEQRFDDVQSIYYELIHRYGLYYLDFKQGNIDFGSGGLDASF